MVVDVEQEGPTTSARASRTRLGVRAWTLRRSRMLAVLAMVVTVSGCSLFSPATTSFPQIQADGVPLTIEGIEFENLVVVAPARGARGVLTGQAVNVTGRPIEVTVSVDRGTTPARFTLAPFAGDGISRMPTNVDLGPIPVIPGATVTLVVSTPGAGANEVSVPVLPPGTGLHYYDGISP